MCSIFKYKNCVGRNFDYEVSYASGKTAFYTDAEAVADVKVLAYTTTNGVRDPEQTPQDVTAAASINANSGVITVDKDGVRVTTLTYSIYETAFNKHRWIFSIFKHIKRSRCFYTSIFKPKSRNSINNFLRI